MTTPYKITVDIESLDARTTPRTTSFDLMVTHWAGDALTLAGVIRESILEQAEPVPSKESKDDTTPVFDTPGGRPRHIPTTEASE